MQDYLREKKKKKKSDKAQTLVGSLNYNATSGY